MTDPRYPTGRFQLEGPITDARRAEWIAAIAAAPAELRSAVDGLTPEQLETPYRPGGWTVRQVVHHLPDSHLNAYIRHRLTLTEDRPTIKPYQQHLWAELFDARNAPIEASLALFEGLHARWTMLLSSLAPADFRREFQHPESGRMVLEENLAMYAWHGRHHIAQINSATNVRSM
jgi:hypothetical protein